MQSLSQAPVNSVQEIKWCTGVESKDDIDKVGLKQGATVRVISADKGNMIISVNGKRIALSREITDRIKI